MAQKPNNKHNKGQRVVRINFSTILYVILLASIGWMLLNNSSAPASKIEWAQVQEMAREGDISEIHFIRNDFKGNITVRPDRLGKYANLFPEGKLPKKSPQFFFLTSTKFDPETEISELNTGLQEGSKVKLYIENETNIWGGILEWVLPIAILLLLYAWMFRSMSRQMGGIQRI